MQNLGSFSDYELQQLIAESDRDAYTLIYDRYAKQINEFLLKFLNSSELSNDLTQDVFIKIWENRRKLSAIRSFKAYLFITARNSALDAIKRSFRSENIISALTNDFAAHRNSAEDQLLNKEYLLFIENILNSIPPRSREIFLLCREQGKSYDDAALELGISRNAVKNHMVFTMKVMRSKAESDLGISLSILLACIFKH